jgi:predicted nucleic acid-binding protein
MLQVIDNTVLTNFCLVDRLDILRTLFGKVYVAHEVRRSLPRPRGRIHVHESGGERDRGWRRLLAGIGGL